MRIRPCQLPSERPLDFASQRPQPPLSLFRPRSWLGQYHGQSPVAREERRPSPPAPGRWLWKLKLQPRRPICGIFCLDLALARKSDALRPSSQLPFSSLSPVSMGALYKTADVTAHCRAASRRRPSGENQTLGSGEKRGFPCVLPISEGAECQMLSAGRLSQIASIADRRRSSSTM